jgi:hypothetical protein
LSWSSVAGACAIWELRRGYLRQQGSGLDPITDVDIALFDVATGARENIRRLKGGRGRRQGNGHFAAAVAHQGNANIRNGS